MSFSPSSDASAPERNNSRTAEPIRIRKYPNRRLYDTSRSQHLTHDGVLALIAEGRTVQVTDSRSGADITNAVLLQIMIERDPAKVASVPSELLHRAMRSDAGSLGAAALTALTAWRTVHIDPSAAAASVRAMSLAASSTEASMAPDAITSMMSRPAHAPAAIGGRPKAKAKRPDGMHDDRGEIG